MAKYDSASKYFDEFQLGEVLDTHGRTLTEADVVNFDRAVLDTHGRTLTEADVNFASSTTSPV